MRKSGESLAAVLVWAIGNLILFAWAIITLFPLYWMISTSFKADTAIMSLPPQWIPSQLTLTNFTLLFERGDVARWTLNTTIMAGVVTFSQLLFASMAGYGFAKKQFPGREIIFWIYIGSMTVPFFAVLIPLYRLMTFFGITDTYLGLIAPGLSAPFGAFLMRQFMHTLPNELMDAGRIDGCSELGVFWRIVLPLAAPGLAVLGIFAFMGEWGQFLWPLVITQSPEMRVLALGVQLLAQYEGGAVNYGLVMAGSTFMAIPMFIVFFAFQRYFLRGISVGALKG